ncbi:hypothetical protein D3C87_378960 [compost metagenome]
MALKSSELVVFKNLCSTLDMLLKMNPDIEKVKEVMLPSVVEFEQLTGHLVRFTKADESWKIVLVDGKKDFVRIRRPNEESKVLRSRINSVQIEVKLQKNDEYEFDNEWVAKALRDLADEVQGSERELSLLEPCDLRKVSEGDADTDTDTDGDEDEDEDGKGPLSDANSQNQLPSVGLAFAQARELGVNLETLEPESQLLDGEGEGVV